MMGIRARRRRRRRRRELRINSGRRGSGQR
jgi:hypothetical protein